MADVEVRSTGKAAGRTGPEEWFTGEVRFDDVTGPELEGVQVAHVTFSDGARTNWHTHGTAQVLHVISGRGFLATRERTRMLEPGDVAQIPAGLDHIHGAVAGADLVHLAISVGGTVWSDPPERPDPVQG